MNEAVQLSLLAAGTGDELLVLERAEGLYTAERFLRLHPERVTFLLRLVALRFSYRKIRALYIQQFGEGIHNMTLEALKAARMTELEEARRGLAGECLSAGRDLMMVVRDRINDMSDDEIKKLGAKDLQALANSAERLLTTGNVLGGGVTARVENVAREKPEEMEKLVVDLYEGRS